MITEEVLKTIKFGLLFALVTLTSLACGLGGLTDLLPGGGGALGTTSELWSDVPRMDGLGDSDIEMPLFARLFMQTMMSQLLGDGEGSGDIVVFRTENTSQAIAAFYSAEQMAANGWAASEGEACLSGSEQGVAQVGLFCVFQKNAADLDTGLMILAVPDENTGQTNLFFIRFENQTTSP